MDNCLDINHSSDRPHELDEFLEGIWKQREKGVNSIDELTQGVSVEKSKAWLKILQDQNLVTLSGNRIDLTHLGEEEARQIVRRHRLTERLFADVFKTREEIWKKDACELEHKSVLTEEAVSAICAFLGHPPTCPHGRPIPRGACCGRFKRDLEPFVIPLIEARLGQPYRIVFIAPQNQSPLERLAVLGILPGGEIRINQKKPSYVLQAGETEVALDPDIAANIYVKKTLIA